MKRLVLGFAVLLAAFSSASAQSTLSAGDVAIVGVTSDGPDEFGVLLLNDVLAGTELIFTDCGWSSSNNALRTGGEDTLFWVTDVNLPAGTLINFTDGSSGGVSDIGRVTSGKMSGLSSSGDQILVFQGTVSSPSFIFAITFNGSAFESDATSSNTTAVPPGLTVGVNAVSIPEADNMLYLSDSIGPTALILGKVCDPNNWTTNDDRADMDPSDNGRQGFLLTNGTPGIRTYTSTYTHDFGQVMVNSQSASFSFTTGGISLTNDIVISVNAPFEVRVGAGNFGSSATITPSAGTVSPTTVEIQVNPTSGGSFSDTIQITSTGAFTNQILVMAEALSNPTVSFLNTNGNFSEGDADDSIGVVIQNKGMATVTVDIVGKPGETAVEGTHFNYANGPQLIFDSSTPDTMYVQISIIDDNIAGPRFRTNKLGLMVNGGDIGTNDSFSISIAENDYAYRKIAEIKQVDADFLPISVDSLFEITGVVYGTNTRTSGYSFTIIDETAGISNFAPSSAPDFGYTITEGDSILMRGRLTHFNGLIQLDFLDTIKLLKSGATLKAPRVMNTLDESSENDFVRINNVAFVGTPPPTWSYSGSGTNYEVYNTVTMDTFAIRILPTSTLANATAPTGMFDVIGIGGQFDGSNPRNSGYQLFPRYDTDVIIDQLGEFDLLNPANNTTVKIEGDPNTELKINWSTSAAMNGGAVPNYSFLLDLPTGDFSAPLLTMSSGTDTMITFTYKALADALGASLAPGSSAVLKWTVKADNGTQTEWASSEFIINLERGIIDGLIMAEQVARIYPNPSSEVLMIDTDGQLENIRLIDMNGKVVLDTPANGNHQEIRVSGFNNGVYILNIVVDGKAFQSRIVIQN